MFGSQPCAVARKPRIYSFKPLPNDRTQFTNEPEDGNDHLMDAANYGAVTHLRRLGIVNDDDVR